MRKLLYISFLALACISARAADQYVVLTITVTNVLGTTNGNTLTVNSDTRMGTNGVQLNPATWFRATNDINKAATNLYNHLALYTFVGPLIPRMLATNQFELTAPLNTNIAFSIGGTWGIGALSTNSAALQKALLLPIDSSRASIRSNNADMTIDMLNRYALTNRFDQLGLAFTNLVGTTNSQNVSNKNLYGSTIAGYGALALSNTWTGTNWFNRLVVTNAINIGGTSSPPQFLNQGLTVIGRDPTLWMNAFDPVKSPLLVLQMANGNEGTPTSASSGEHLGRLEIDGYGGTDYQLGFQILAKASADFNASNAPTTVDFTVGTPTGTLLNPLGLLVMQMTASSISTTNLTVGTNIKTLTLNASNVVATNVTIGGAGASLRATNAHLDVANMTVTNFNALGGTATNLNLAAANAAVTNLQAYGGMVSNILSLHQSSLSNNTFRGSNDWNGDVAWTFYSMSSLANGNNVAVAFTNRNVRLAGTLTAAGTVNGILGGRDGKEHFVWNDTGQSVTVAHDSGVDPTPANRIYTPQSADVVVAHRGWFVVEYSGAYSRWILKDSYPATATATNAVAFLDGNATNLTVWSSAATKVNLKVSAIAAPGTNLVEVSNSTNVWAIKTNGQMVIPHGAVNGYFLTTDGSGHSSWAAVPAGGGGTFNTTQFDASGSSTNIKDRPFLTNVVTHTGFMASNAWAWISGKITNDALAASLPMRSTANKEMTAAQQVWSNADFSNISFLNNAAGDLPVFHSTTVLTNLSLPPFSYGAPLLSDGTRPFWGNQAVRYEDDFIAPSDASGREGSQAWAETVSAGGDVVQGNGEPGRPGIIELRSASGTTDRATILGGSTTMCVSNGVIFCEASVKMPILSTTTEDYSFRIGFGDSATAPSTDGIAWYHTNNGVTATWVMAVSVGGATTYKNSISNTLADTWTYVAFLIDAEGTNCFGYIGTSRANAAVAVTNDLKTLGLINTMKFGPILSHNKIAGTTPRTNWIDYYNVYQFPSVTR